MSGSYAAGVVDPAPALLRVNILQELGVGGLFLSMDTEHAGPVVEEFKAESSLADALTT